MRRRGYTPEGIRDFIAQVGVSKKDSVSELALLEHCQRQDLNARAPRVMGVLRPLRVVLENYPEGESEQLEAVNNPEDPAAGSRSLPFGRVLYIESDDFREDPPPKYFRLAPGREVRLRWAYFIRCVDVVKDESGEVIELRCTYDPETRGGNAPDGRKVKATIHWVAGDHALEAEVRLYNRLFTEESPEADEDFVASIDPASLEVLTECRVEPSLADAQPGFSCQFERLGYFCVDPDASPDRLVFNRTVSLRDEWARMERRSS
jgi:glutaminyl-tRNA synthetase